MLNKIIFCLYTQRTKLPLLVRQYTMVILSGCSVLLLRKVVCTAVHMSYIRVKESGYGFLQSKLMFFIENMLGVGELA